MESQFQREELLIGKEGIEKLKNSKIAVYGIGGVGSFVCEALARAGVGDIIIIDKDKISESNINRQIHATHKTIGKYKVQIMKERIIEIYPKCNVQCYLPQNMDINEIEIIDKSFSYVIDSVDTIATKIEIIERCNKINVPIISCMGTGNKLDATQFKFSDIYKTSVCPLAKKLRKELRNRGINKLKVLYSEEVPNAINKEKVIGSISFVPSIAGLLIAGEVIKDILNN